MKTLFTTALAGLAPVATLFSQVPWDANERFKYKTGRPHPAVEREVAGRNVSDRFRQFDRNRDGVVTSAERAEAERCHCDCPAHR